MAPGEETPEHPVFVEKVTATPAQTSAAVSKARQAVAPQKNVALKNSLLARTVTYPQSKGVVRGDKDSWMLSEGKGNCSPISEANAKSGT